MGNIELPLRDIDRIIQILHGEKPEIQVRQISKVMSTDDDGLWWFSIPGFEPNIQLESPSGYCPFLVETNEQSSRQALKATTVDEAVAMIGNYLVSVSSCRPVMLPGQPFWE